MIAFLETPGAESGPLLPTGNVRDTVQGIEITCVEKGMPVVIMDARALGRTGYETVDDLNNDTGLKARIEAIRLEAGPMMGLGDVEKTTVPKMFLVAPPLHGGAIHTRSFIPHVCHEAVGVFAAVSVGAACAIPGTVAAGLAVVPEARRKLMAVEHPSGEMTVEIEIGGTAEKPEVVRAGMLRTARRLFAGEVLIPGSVWAGARALRTAAE
jgi:4-oxalomesaconate tautomerase